MAGKPVVLYPKAVFSVAFCMFAERPAAEQPQAARQHKQAHRYPQNPLRHFCASVQIGFVVQFEGFWFCHK